MLVNSFPSRNDLIIIRKPLLAIFFFEKKNVERSLNGGQVSSNSKCLHRLAPREEEAGDDVITHSTAHMEKGRTRAHFTHLLLAACVRRGGAN